MTERGILSALSEQKIRWITYQEFQWDTGKWFNKRKEITIKHTDLFRFPDSQRQPEWPPQTSSGMWGPQTAPRHFPHCPGPGASPQAWGQRLWAKLASSSPHLAASTEQTVVYYFLHYTSWMNKGWSCKLIMPNPDLPVQTTWKFVVHRLLPLTTHKVQDLSRTIRCVTRDPAGGKDDVTLTVTL